MIRAVGIGVLLAAAFVGPLAAGEKKVTPRLTHEVRDGLQITRENIVRLKLKAIQPVQPNLKAPPVGGHLPAPPPALPGS